MRKFESAHDSLRDVRIAYTFLLALALALAVMGLVASKYETRLYHSELVGYRETLAECAGSLRDYLSAEASGDGYAQNAGENGKSAVNVPDTRRTRRIEAAARFRNAAAKLDCSDDARAVLLNFAGIMQYGEPDPADVRKLSDIFTGLASLDYENREAARECISDTMERITGIGEAQLPENDAAQSEPPAEGSPDSILSKYAYSSARAGAVKLIGSIANSLSLEKTGNVIETGAENLRARFSAVDGSAESLVYIRLGRIPDAFFSNGELASYAENLISDVLNKRAYSLMRAKELCGFTVFCFDSEKESGEIRVALDSHGRLWAFDRDSAEFANSEP